MWDWGLKHLQVNSIQCLDLLQLLFFPTVTGYPDPEVIWYKDDQSIKESRHFQIDYDEDGNCSLTISEVCGDDDAKYTCKAVNSLGEATCTAELLVETMGKEEEEEEEEE